MAWTLLNALIGISGGLILVLEKKSCHQNMHLFFLTNSSLGNYSEWDLKQCILKLILIRYFPGKTEG